MNDDIEEIFTVENLTVVYSTESNPVTAVDNVSFTIAKGEAVGLVGESGCGKTTLALSILGLLSYNTTAQVSGRVLFKGINLPEMSEEELTLIRGKEIAFAFQEPLLALNPLFTVGDQISETLKQHQVAKAGNLKQRTLDLLRQVNLTPAESAFASYPHQLSGGMRQRAMLAMALSCRPRLLIADEPTSALDAPLRTQILNELASLCRKDDICLLLITHNIAYASTFCDRFLIMYKGRLMEQGPVEAMIEAASHPYSLLLLNVTNGNQSEDNSRSSFMSGNKPKSDDAGCNYFDRCPRRLSKCAINRPMMNEISPRHSVACWNPRI